MMKMRGSHGCSQRRTLEMVEQTGLSHVILPRGHTRLRLHSASASCMINLAARSRKGNGLVTCFSSRILPSGVS